MLQNCGSGAAFFGAGALRLLAPVAAIPLAVGTAFNSPPLSTMSTIMR